MTELVIVATDLYLASGLAASVTTQPRLPGLARIARFGRIEAVLRGWRSGLADWVGRSDLASLPPAAVAAARIERQDVAAESSVWFADPIHLAASLTSVHLMPRGLLRLDAATQTELCAAFDAAFMEAGYRLAPTRAGRFLAMGPLLEGEIVTNDPARWLGATLERALPRGSGAAALRRLGAEIEMWLHEHPLNARRGAAHRAPVSTLWLWGGGAPLARQMARSTTDNRPPPAAFFSDDAYVDGLAHLLGAHCAPPRTLAAVGLASERRIVVTLELFTLGETDSRAAAAPLLTLEVFDREWLAPALDELARGSLERLTLVANDRRASIASRDRWRLWRRSRSALAALAAGTPSDP